MSRFEAEERVELVRSAVTVPRLLAHFGIRALKERGRMVDPLVGGDNPSAFSYEPERWYSFKLGRGGDVFALAMELGRLSFPDALALCANVGGIRLSRLDPAVARRAIAERRRIAEERRAAEHGWWTRWSKLIRQLDLARDDAFIVQAALRADPERRLRLTRDIQRTFGPAIRLRDELEQRVEDLEIEWRAWAARCRG